MGGALISTQLLPAIRELYSRRPECFRREPSELRHVLFSLGCTDDLTDEAEISAAVDVARQGGPQRRAA